MENILNILSGKIKIKIHVYIWKKTHQNELPYLEFPGKTKKKKNLNK